MIDDTNTVDRKYRLIGVVSHIGDSSVVGHYISDVYDCKENEWKSYNDSSVKKVSYFCYFDGSYIHSFHLTSYFNYTSFIIIIGS